MFREFKYNYIVIPSIAILFSLILYNIILNNMYWYTHLHKPMFYPNKHIFRFICTGSMFFLTMLTSIIWNKMFHSHSFRIILATIIGIMCIIFSHTIALFILKNLKLAFVLKSVETFALTYLAYKLFEEAQIITLCMIPYIAWSIFICILEYKIFIINS